MLRFTADRRSIAYLTATVLLGILQWNLPSLNVFLYVASLFMAVTVAVIAHNHNHLSIWKSRVLNVFTSYVISVHYGHPAIGWVPTHNQNHHRHNNGEKDLSRSPVFFKRNHLAALLVYPTATSFRQMAAIRAYFGMLWKTDRRSFCIAATEYLVFFGVMAMLFALDWRKALLFYVIPQQFALFTIQVFNYVQHIECDRDSKWNHSRNFVSPLLNALLFNNGYHTVHHFKPGVHWSQTPAIHREYAAEIHPDLNVRSWWYFMTSVFAFSRSARPRPLAVEVATAAAVAAVAA